MGDIWITIIIYIVYMHTVKLVNDTDLSLASNTENEYAIKCIIFSSRIPQPSTYMYTPTPLANIMVFITL